MDQILCKSCKLNPAGVKCMCNRQPFCDACFDSHTNYYMDHIHIPEVISQTLTWKYQFPIALQLSQKDQINQVKEQLINKFILKSIKQLSEFKDLLLKKESETMSTFIKLFNSLQVNEGELGEFNNYLNGIDNTHKLIETSELDSKISGFKDELIKDIKSLYEYKHCNLCYKKIGELVTLDCLHKLCSECYVKTLGQQTDNFYVYNQIEVPKPTYCPLDDCTMEIKNENIEKNLPNYKNYEDQARERLIIFCKACGKQGKINEIIVCCMDLCNECNINSIRNKHKACDICQVLFSDNEIEALTNVEFECEGCMEKKKFFLNPPSVFASICFVWDVLKTVINRFVI